MTLENFFNIANLTRRRDVFTVRQERIKREGSPYYNWNVPATAAGAQSVIGVREEFPQARKYEPLDWIEVVNNEANNVLTLTINGTESFTVPAKSIRTIDNLALWHITITNNGGVITTLGNIRVTLQKQPMTIDKWAQRQR